MEIIEIKNLSFAYPNRDTRALENINISVAKGEFVTLCGKSGCGKTTLLRLLKSAIAPFGDIEGGVYFDGVALEEVDSRTQAQKIGFVMQSPENQIVTDKVWHELAFGLESLGYSTPEIRTRISEMASFFCIHNWFYKNVTELSGGQKQLLNLASVMVMQPSVLILDEPTSQLDPIAADEFLKTLEKINRELGTTVILSEHRLEEAFSLSDRVIVMDSGRVIADDTPRRVGEILKTQNHDMYLALPAPVRVFGAVESESDCPLTVREGRAWLEEYAKSNPINFDIILKSNNFQCKSETVIKLDDVWFRYEKNLPDVVKGMSVQICKGEVFAILGGNGTGKTTALSLISGLNKPYRGKICIKGTDIEKNDKLYDGVLGVLPQNPQTVFAKKTVYLDLMDMLSESKISRENKESLIRDMSELCHIENLMNSHPYDLSGGEQQRVALAKILLKSPEILLLDEPTKGLDSYFKREFADILHSLKARGVTIVMVSHDIEFCAEFADRCALFFDGNITSVGEPREFFCGKNFYTTSANRMARTTIADAILADDIILALGGKVQKRQNKTRNKTIEKQISKPEKQPDLPKRLTVGRIVSGSIFALLFVLTNILYLSDSAIFDFMKISFAGMELLQIVSAMEIVAIFICFFPGGDFGSNSKRSLSTDRKLAGRTIVAALLILLAIPLTIYAGFYFLGDRKYYFISLLIILETIIPFCMVFESRKPQGRELVVISVLCAIAVAGRTAFFMLPQFKPVVALVIIAGVCFGGETGFLVGAVTGFVSNFFFGQGSWTPWQMFAFGIIGFLAGILFKKGLLRKNRASLCIFGFFATFVIYGGIMNPSSVIMYQANPTAEMIISSYIVGVPFDIVHSLGTAFFLWFISEPMIDKLERIKVKYGLIER